MAQNSIKGNGLNIRILPGVLLIFCPYDNCNWIRISKWTFYRGNEKENTTQNSSRHQQMKESISMGQIQATGNYPDAVPAKMLGGLKNGNKGKHSK